MTKISTSLYDFNLVLVVCFIHNFSFNVVWILKLEISERAKVG